MRVRLILLGAGTFALNTASWHRLRGACGRTRRTYLGLVVVACLLRTTAALPDSDAQQWAELFTAYARARHLEAVVALLPDAPAPGDWQRSGPEAALSSVAEEFCAWQVEREGTSIWYVPSVAVDRIATSKAKFVSATSEFVRSLPEDLASAVGSSDALLLERLPPRLQELGLYAVAPIRPIRSPEQILERALLPDERLALRPELRVIASFYPQAMNFGGGLLGTPVWLNAYKGDSLFFPCPFQFASKPGETVLRSLHQDCLTFDVPDLPQHVAAPAVAACPLWANGMNQTWEDRLAQSRFPECQGQVWSVGALASALGKAASCEVLADRRLAGRQLFVLVPEMDALNLLCWVCNATGTELRVVEEGLFLGCRKAPEVPRFGMSLADAQLEQSLLQRFVARASPGWPPALRTVASLAGATGFFDSERLQQPLRRYLSCVQQVHRQRDPTGHYPELPEQYWVRLSMMVEVELVALVPHEQPRGETLWQPHEQCSHFRQYVVRVAEAS